MIIEETTEVTEKDEGFTLVELLIVIVILGILATIVVFAVRGITDKGQENACRATAKTYEVAIEAYYANFGNENDPSGAELEAAGLLRKYETKNITITEGTTASLTDFSTVAVTPASECTASMLL